MSKKPDYRRMVDKFVKLVDEEQITLECSEARQLHEDAVRATSLRFSDLLKRQDGTKDNCVFTDVFEIVEADEECPFEVGNVGCFLWKTADQTLPQGIFFGRYKEEGRTLTAYCDASDMELCRFKPRPNMQLAFVA